MRRFIRGTDSQSLLQHIEPKEDKVPALGGSTSKPATESTDGEEMHPPFSLPE